MPASDDLDLLGEPLQNAGQQDGLENAEVLPLVHAQQPPPIWSAMRQWESSST